MTQDELYSYMQQPERLSGDTLSEIRSLQEIYPYAPTCVFLYLFNLAIVRDVIFPSELGRLAPYLPNRRKLFRLISGYLKSETLEAHTADDRDSVTSSSFDLIDDFLTEMRNAGADLPDELVYNHAPMADDYFPHHAVQSPLQAEPCNRPLVASSSEALIPSDNEDGGDIAESLFTETLAKVYIRQGRYEKALQIIRSLHLHYPQKSAYFADQIRFIEKLIENNKLI